MTRAGSLLPVRIGVIAALEVGGFPEAERLGERPVLAGRHPAETTGCRRQMRYSFSAFFEKSAVCSSRLKPEMISV